MKQAVMRTVLSLAMMMIGTGAARAQSAREPVALTPGGAKLQAEYATMVKALRATITGALPTVDPKQEAVFMEAHYHEGPKKGKQGKQAERAKPLRWPGKGTYQDFHHERDTLEKARPLLAQLDGLLGSDALDESLVRCTVLATATLRGLAAFAQQGAKQKALIDKLLTHDRLMTDFPLPFTIGSWQDSKPVKVSLVKGKNSLRFTRSLPEDYAKISWQHSGPQYGGVTLRSFALTPAPVQ